MTSILVVCTGNICRSPMAQGLLRAALDRRLGGAAPDVSSAGTAGLRDVPATPEAVEAVGELGIDIAEHRGRRLTVPMASEADLLLCMTTDHRDAIVRAAPELAPRAFTLKELVRLLEVLPPSGAGGSLSVRLEEADAARHDGRVPPSRDDDVADPLGQPFEGFRAIAWELGEWIDRLVDGLYGSATQSDAGVAAGA